MAHVHGAHKKTAAIMTAIEKTGSAIKHSKNHQAGKTLAAGLAAGACKATLKTIASHPATLLGIGFAFGFLTYWLLSSPENE